MDELLKLPLEKNEDKNTKRWNEENSAPDYLSGSLPPIVKLKKAFTLIDINEQKKDSRNIQTNLNSKILR